MQFKAPLKAVALKEGANNAIIDMADGTTSLLTQHTVAIYAGDNPRALAVVANTVFADLTDGDFPDEFVDLSTVRPVVTPAPLKGGAVTAGVETKQSRPQAEKEAANAENKNEDEPVVVPKDSGGDTGTEFD